MSKKVNKNQLSLFSLDFFPDTIQNLTQLLLKVRNIKYEIEKKRNIEYLNSLDDEEFLNEMNSECIFKSEGGEFKNDIHKNIRYLSVKNLQTMSDSSIQPPYLTLEQMKTLRDYLHTNYDSFSSITLYYNYRASEKEPDNFMSWQEWEKMYGIGN